MGFPALQYVPCSDTEQERCPLCGEPTPAVPFRMFLWFPAEEQQGANSFLTPTTCGTPAASSATPEKQRNPTAPRLFPESHTPRSHLAGCKRPGTLRGAEKEMTYYCLLFHSANREAFIADGTQGNVTQNGEKENAAGKITSIRRGVKRQSAPASQKTGKSRGDSSHEHVIIAWRRKVVRIWPRSPNSYGAKGVKSGAWWNCSWGKPAWDA